MPCGDALTIAKVNGRVPLAGNACAASRAGGGSTVTLEVREIAGLSVDGKKIRRGLVAPGPATFDRCLLGGNKALVRGN